MIVKIQLHHTQPLRLPFPSRKRPCTHLARIRPSSPLRPPP
jgi:hypothetical protein